MAFRLPSCCCGLSPAHIRGGWSLQATARLSEKAEVGRQVTARWIHGYTDQGAITAKATIALPLLFILQCSA